tara:strand:- start:181 stop:381 length:201 start_codon:yes stop_codon:yes gene_type:complete
MNKPNMDFLLCSIGTPGPLIVEHGGKLFRESCFTITGAVIERMKSKIGGLKFNKFEQTTDRSYILY